MLNKWFSYKSAAYCLFVFVFSNLALANKIIYVDDDATGTNDGSSWQNAYIYLQDALADANSSEKPVEIHMAQGIYKPHEAIISLPFHFDWMASFYLINGVTIKGGFAGVKEPDPNARNVTLYPSILSGDLNNDDIEVEDSSELLNQTTKSDNSSNVVTSSGNDANAILDGFTITGGCNMLMAEPGPAGGAGIAIYVGNPTIINCTFLYNAALDSGGGILILGGSPKIIDCLFSKNYASQGAGIRNGKRYVRNPSVAAIAGNPIIINCVFNNNYAYNGAGIYNEGNPAITNCIFKRNISENKGGCIFGEESMVIEYCNFIQNTAGIGGAIATSANLTLKNCIFLGNRALGTHYYSEGGGACRISGENTTITNCTFYGNWAKQNVAIYKTSSSILNISNSILWNEENKISDSNSTTLIVRYSDIQGGLEGEENINSDPLFVMLGYWADANDPNIVVEPNDANAVWIDGDYHLKSQAGRFFPNSQTWVQDDVTSPCIDAGDPNSPIGLEPFPNGGYINMGAYGGTAEASKSYFGKPVCETIVAGDINGDCKVDILDLEILLNHWLEEH